jgi:molybdate transport system substrate-binding protein
LRGDIQAKHKKATTMLRYTRLSFCLALGLSSTAAQAETALAAVAANFAEAAAQLAAQFHTDTGHELALTTGSTGKLFAQIGQGAPFDLMLSADAETPARLHDQGHGKPQAYAVGILTLWAPKLLPDQNPTTALEDARLRHIAIANPELAPYGKAAIVALGAMGLNSILKDKIVMGQNVGQTFALVQSGAAEAGFIAKSALPSDAEGLVWDVAPGLYPPIQQDAIVLKHGAENPAALAFMDYLNSAAGQSIITKYGYRLP